MTLSNRTHFVSLFAAIICAFVTVGASVGPVVIAGSSLIA